MKNVWRIIYFGLLITAPYAGFTSLRPEQTAKTNPDWVFISISFVCTLLFPLMALGFSRVHGIKQFMRPTFGRNFLRWWSDPLQPLRFCVYASILTAAGASLAVPTADAIGKLTFYWYLALAAGLILGERIAYHIFRERIVEPSPPPYSSPVAGSESGEA